MSLESLGIRPCRYFVASQVEGKLGDWKVGYVEILIDPAGLAESLGPRALRNLSGKAIEAGGKVVIRVAQ